MKPKTRRKGGQHVREVGSIATTLRHPIRTAKAAVRKEAAAGARDAVMPWVMLSVALSLYALSKGR